MLHLTPLRVQTILIDILGYIEVTFQEKTLEVLPLLKQDLLRLYQGFYFYGLLRALLL